MRTLLGRYRACVLAKRLQRVPDWIRPLLELRVSRLLLEEVFCVV